MIRRTIPLLFVLGILLTIAPAAMAHHCWGCKIRPLPHTEPPSCVVRLNFGFAICEPNEETDSCTQSMPCGSHMAAMTPMAAEFKVASVERLDEPQTPASDTQVARAQAPQPATR
jgi:hypothetical protein